MTGLLDSILNRTGHLALFFDAGGSHIGGGGDLLHTVGNGFRRLYQLVHKICGFGGFLMYGLGYVQNIIQYFFYMVMFFPGRTDGVIIKKYCDLTGLQNNNSDQEYQQGRADGIHILTVDSLRSLNDHDDQVEHE